MERGDGSVVALLARVECDVEALAWVRIRVLTLVNIFVWLGLAICPLEIESLSIHVDKKKKGGNEQDGSISKKQHGVSPAAGHGHFYSRFFVEARFMRPPRRQTPRPNSTPSSPPRSRVPGLELRPRPGRSQAPNTNRVPSQGLLTDNPTVPLPPSLPNIAGGLRKGTYLKTWRPHRTPVRPVTPPRPPNRHTLPHPLS